MELLALLEELCDAFGPSGFENEIRETIRRRVAPLVDEVRETPVGSLVAIRRARIAKDAATARNAPKTVLLDAHIDEVGLIVNRVEANGFLRFAPLGGIDPRVLPAHRVQVRSREGKRRLGVVGVRPPHLTEPDQRGKAIPLEELHIDLGCSNREEVEALGIGPGAPAVIHYPFAEIEGGCVAAKALDNRAGCAVALLVLDALKNEPLPYDLAAAFSTQEEMGRLGAETAAREIRPNAALVLEATTATDTPDVPAHKKVCSLRQGPAITIADSNTIVPERMFRFLEDLAREADIPYQFKTPRVGGGTNAGAVQRRGAGVLTGILSVPCRYIHSSASVLHVEDLRAAAALAERFLRQIERLGLANS